MHPTQRIGCSELRAVKPLWSSISPYVGGVLKTANVELITAEEESVHVSQRVMRCNAVDICSGFYSEVQHSGGFSGSMLPCDPASRRKATWEADQQAAERDRTTTRHQRLARAYFQTLSETHQRLEGRQERQLGMSSFGSPPALGPSHNYVRHEPDQSEA